MKARLFYLRYRERTVIVFFLCCLMVAGVLLLSLLERFIDEYCFVSLFLAVLFLAAGVVYNKSKRHGNI